MGVARLLKLQPKPKNLSMFTKNTSRIALGTPLNPSNMRSDFNYVLKESGLPKIRFHDLRHTAASKLLNEWVSKFHTSRILDHTKTSTTLNTYGHLFTKFDGEAARVMDGAVSSTEV